MGSFRLAAILLASLSLVEAILKPQILSVSPSSGSAGGGVTLTISGTGFSSDQYVGGNTVWVGPYKCMVNPHQTSTTAITCKTSAGAYGTYSVVVVVDGAASSTGGSFTYDRQFTSGEGPWLSYASDEYQSNEICVPCMIHAPSS